MSLLGRVLKRAFGHRPDGADGRREGLTAPANGDIAVLMQRAEAFFNARRLEEAQALFRRVLDRDAGNRKALLRLGVIAAHDGRYRDARDLLERVVKLFPDCVDGFNALANVARLEERWQDARACYGKALEVDPGSVAVLANLGTCLRDMGRVGEARTYLTRALEIEPENADLLLDFALVLIDAGDTDAARSCLRRVLVIDPGSREARAALGHLLLLNGEFEEGWREYGQHHRIERAERHFEHPYPYWKGESIEREVILVRAEQGLGDQVMFASCLPDIQSRAGSVVLECDPRLAPIFARSFPAVRVYPKDEDNAARWREAGLIPDKQVFLSSLPRHFRNSWDAFPVRTAYLVGDPAKIARWRAKLDGLGPGLKIGFSWRGGTPQTRQSLRSIPLARWMPLFESRGNHWISLQYGNAAAEVQALARSRALPLHHWEQAIDDYEETAALIAALDLVISVQTAAVHLAGALGRPAWAMVAFAPEWRYLAHGDRLPWYASVEVLRQHRPGEWSSVLDAVHERLVALGRRQDAI